MPAASPPSPPTPGTAPEVWTPGPAHPLLCEGIVDVWRVDLTTTDGELCATLNDEERERAGRLLSEHDRRLWMRSRGTLRALLGRYLDEDPRTLRFGSGPHGKPDLLDDAPDRAAASSRVSFNLSHSADVALYAFAASVCVGVDVEVARRAIDEVAIAARTFGAAEAERLRELDPDARRSEFLRAWVRHEAQLKCLGVGIGGADTVRDQGGAGARRGESRPWVVQLDVGTRAEAAVAVDAAPQELRCWEWQGLAAF
jgi:4'-phosphopantetheinyl transferase